MTKDDQGMRRILETWLEAYDESMFPALTPEEQTRANAALKACRVVRARLTAHFGRHMAKCLLRDLDKLEKSEDD